jgi:hypothetical protein
LNKACDDPIIISRFFTLYEVAMTSSHQMRSELLDKKDVRLLFFNGRAPRSGPSTEYNEVYRHWVEIWEPHFRERDGIEKLASDNFTRQDEICALFLGETCISTLCGRVMDLRQPADVDDSYFQIWDEKSLNALKKNGPIVALMNQLTVIPRCPSFREGVRVRDVMLHLVLSHLHRCDVHGVGAVARKDKGMHHSLALIGGETVRSDVPLHGGSVDLMVFFPDGKVTQDPRVIEVSNYIWNNNQLGKPKIAERPLSPKAA